MHRPTYSTIYVRNDKNNKTNGLTISNVETATNSLLKYVLRVDNGTLFGKLNLNRNKITI